MDRNHEASPLLPQTSGRASPPIVIDPDSDDSDDSGGFRRASCGECCDGICGAACLRLGLFECEPNRKAVDGRVRIHTVPLLLNVATLATAAYLVRSLAAAAHASPEGLRVTVAARCLAFAVAYTLYVSEALLASVTLPLARRVRRVVMESLGPWRACCAPLGRLSSCCWQLRWLAANRSLVRDGVASTRRTCVSCCGLSFGSCAPHFSTYVTPDHVRFTHFDSYFAGGEGAGDAADGSAIQAYFNDLCLAEPDVVLQHSHVSAAPREVRHGSVLIDTLLCPFATACRIVAACVDVCCLGVCRDRTVAGVRSNAINSRSSPTAASSFSSYTHVAERTLLSGISWLDSSSVPGPRKTARLASHRLVRVQGEVRVVFREEAARVACVRQHGKARADLARAGRWHRTGAGGASATSSSSSSNSSNTAGSNNNIGPGDSDDDEDSYSDVEEDKRSFSFQPLDAASSSGCASGSSFREELYLHMSAAAAAGLPSTARDRSGGSGRGSPSSAPLHRRVVASETCAVTFVHGAAPLCVRSCGMHGCYVLFTLLGFAWAFRMWFEFQSIRVHFVLVKTLREFETSVLLYTCFVLSLCLAHSLTHTYTYTTNTSRQIDEHVAAVVVVVAAAAAERAGYGCDVQR